MCISKYKTQLISKGALYRKMMQYGIKLSTKHSSETKNNFLKFLFKMNHFFGKKKELFTIFQLRLRYFVIKIVLNFNILPIFGSACF